MEKSLDKKELRNKYKHIRDNIPFELRKEKSQSIIENLLALLESDFKGADIFLCFYPFASEVDLFPLYRGLINEGKSLYFPVSNVQTHTLTFRKVTDLDKDFICGFHNIMEPKESLEEFCVSERVVCITPGLIFDKNGNRVGYGAGFYDRFFELYPSINKIAVCFEEQLRDNLIAGEYDKTMDYIVTDVEIIKRGTR